MRQRGLMCEFIFGLQELIRVCRDYKGSMGVLIRGSMLLCRIRVRGFGIGLGVRQGFGV